MAFLYQPQVNEEGPDMGWVQEPPVFVPDIPVLEQPLISDDFRRVKLNERLSPHSIIQQLPLKTVVDKVYVVQVD